MRSSAAARLATAVQGSSGASAGPFPGCRGVMCVHVWYRLADLIMSEATAPVVLSDGEFRENAHEPRYGASRVAACRSADANGQLRVEGTAGAVWGRWHAPGPIRAATQGHIVTVWLRMSTRSPGCRYGPDPRRRMAKLWGAIEVGGMCRRTGQHIGPSWPSR